MRPPSGRLLDRATGEVVVQSLEIADTFWSRFKGLQFRRALPRESGLLLVPCSSIHTFWMRFPIDVIFLGPRGEVLDVRPHVRPWRVTRAVPSTHAILEVPAHSWRLELPVSLAFESFNPVRIPSSVQFLSVLCK